MNCPLCSSPLLFGATNCPCGYNLATSIDDELPIELSYWESLRAFWRIYWPMQLAAGLFSFLLSMVFAGEQSPELKLFILPFQIALTGALVFLFVPRICRRPYRGFQLVVVDVATGSPANRLTLKRRAQAAIFLWWRQILASLFASLLAMPLNTMLSLMGVQISQWIAVFAGVLIVGPILLKMLIGHDFEDFRLEARRGSAGAPVARATAA